MIQLEKTSKTYQTRNGEVRALDEANLNIQSGEFAIIRGPSGSGKSTLLLTLGGMLRPSSGLVKVDGQEIYSLSSSDRAKFRANKIGFIFQMFHLISYLTVLENVLMAANGQAGKRNEALELLEHLGLTHRVNHKPSELSAGERQRVAVARALITQPAVILADEPTGNLDPDNAREILSHLSTYRRKGGTVLLVTHGTAGDEHADRLFYLNQGKIVEQS